MKKTGAPYIITVMEYLTRWVETQPVKDCIGEKTTKFCFEYVLTRFGYLKVLMSDRGMHSLNKMISALTDKFQVYHQKTTLYHPSANGVVEDISNIWNNMLTKIYNA